VSGVGASSGTVVTIERLANGGDGVGRLADGRTVFVPRAAPGDTVRLGQIRTYTRFARARIAELLQPGPGRVEARCAHYTADACGGCQLQHLDARTQLEAKRDMVADALVRIGRLAVEVPPVIAAPEAWGYRTRVALALAPGRRHAGFHPVDQATRVFPLDDCRIAAPALMALWQGLRPHLHLLPMDATQVVLRLDRDGHRHVVVRARGDQPWPRPAALGERLSSVGVAATLWWHPDRGAPRVVAGAAEAFPATVFEQVHPMMGDRVRDHALAGLGPVAGLHAWDLYAGIGETSERLLAAGATVDSVELDRRAVEFAQRRGHAGAGGGSQRPVAGGITRHAGKVEELVANLPAPGAVIANPPRAGLAPRVTEVLAERRPARIVYVSCDPATLARDLAKLCAPVGLPAGPALPYRIAGVQSFDLFPQTAHVETVALLVLA
jgi:23S rRNA (uracil1939-C5)-methyltransferase